jgi:hypothetical protein
MNDSKEHTSITPESILTSVEAMFAASSERLDRELQKSRAEFDQRHAKSEKETEALRELVKQVSQQLGGIGKNNGLIAEEYFFNSFKKGEKKIFGERFDQIAQNLKGTETADEYDIVMLNGQALGIVEVKHKAHENDLANILTKAETFRKNFPKYANHRVYLGLASMAFYPVLEEECTKQGIAIIKQVGGTMVVNEENLKTF